MFLPFILLVCAVFSRENHNIHLTYSKVLVEEKHITIRTSYFMDDFELMLSQFHGKPMSGLRHNGDSDSLLLPYVKKHFVVQANGDTLTPSIVSSGTEADMCFYIVSYLHKDPIQEIRFSNTLLFAEFDDQKNMISVQHLDTDETWSFYCVPGNSSYSMIIK